LADHIRAKSQAIRLEASKIHADNSALILAPGQLVQLTPGPLGYGTVSQLRSYAPRIEYGQPDPAAVTALPAEQATSAMLPEPAGPAELPTAPSFSSLLDRGYTPSPERMLLGYSSQAPLYGKITDLLSVAIAGRPGQGKSTLLRF